MGENAADDVIKLLEQQHQHISDLFDAVEQASGAERREHFDRLRRFLAVHETAEELVVHPPARGDGQGNDVVDARLLEERHAKELLSELEGMDVEADSFSSALAQLRTSVMAHARNEEREEFPLLRQHTDEATRARLATAVRAAEALAPTHPHPGVESATANVMAGPLASLVDRTRDAVTSVLRRR